MHTITDRLLFDTEPIRNTKEIYQNSYINSLNWNFSFLTYSNFYPGFHQVIGPKESSGERKHSLQTRELSLAQPELWVEFRGEFLKKWDDLLVKLCNSASTQFLKKSAQIGQIMLLNVWLFHYDKISCFYYLFLSLNLQIWQS